MSLQVSGHVTGRLDGVREGLLPRLQDRVGGVPGVQRHGAVVGVDHGLDAVAHVVHIVLVDVDVSALRQGVAGRIRPAQPRRVRVRVGGGVAIDQPHDPAVDHCRVRVGVHSHPRGDTLDPGQRIAVVKDLGLRSDQAGQQDVRLGELRGVHDPVQRRADVHTTDAVVSVVALTRRAGVVREIELTRPARTTDDRVGRRLLTEVDTRLVDLQLASRWDVLREELRLPFSVGTVVVGRHEAIAVRVDQSVVGPVALGGRDCGQIHLAGADDRPGPAVGQGVPVHIEGVGERVEGTNLLQLPEGRGDDRRVQQSDVVQRALVGLQRLLVRLAHRGVLRALHVGQVVRLPGGLDVAADERRLLARLVRPDLELLHDRRVDAADDQRRDRQQAQAHQRQRPGAPEDVEEEQHRTDQRDERQDRLGR